MYIAVKLRVHNFMLRLKTILIPQKQIKFLYYLSCLGRELLPGKYLRNQLKSKLSSISNRETKYLLQRLNYYNKLKESNVLNLNLPKLKTYKMPRKHKVYYFDFIEYAKYFDKELGVNVLELDVTHVPEIPTIVKSRPIGDNNENSVLLKLNKIRHFNFVKYDIPYSTKKDILIWRGNVLQEHRKKFFKMYFNHPMCDIGDVNRNAANKDFVKDKISINKHLECKFILTIEGNDVASNLKWVMSSNSVAVSPKPKFETWFMEGILIPDHHYIAIRDDFADLDEKLNFYLKHPEKVQQIIKNANEHVQQFKNKYQEDLLSLLVLEKYFVQTGQMDPISQLQASVK